MRILNIDIIKRYLLTEPVASAIQRSINQEIHPQYQHVRHAEQGIRRRSHQEHNGPLKAMLGEAALIPADEDQTDLEHRQSAKVLLQIHQCAF